MSWVEKNQKINNGGGTIIWDSRVLQNEIENSYYKVMTECDRNLLQSVSVITECVRY